MKNIFLIPTDKESRLWRDLDSNKLTFDNLSHSNSNECTKCSHEYVYITSDEEIKEGDWCLDKFNQRWKLEDKKLIAFDSKGIKRFSTDNILGHECKKIILTTDQDLIKDGVQAIDDEFLEWFVNNPSCEEVEVYKSGGHYDGAMEFYIDVFYSITIPKEERKKNFYCGDEVDYGEQCDFQCERCVNCTGVDYGYLPKEDLGYTTKIGIKVVDGMVRPLMVPKKYFGEEKVYNNVFHHQTRWLFDWLSKNDYLTDSREVIEKEFEEYLKK